MATDRINEAENKIWYPVEFGLHPLTRGRCCLTPSFDRVIVLQIFHQRAAGEAVNKSTGEAPMSWLTLCAVRACLLSS